MSNTIELSDIELHQKPVQQEASASAVGGHIKLFIELDPSFENLLEQQTRMLLGRLLDGRLRVREPFVVELSKDGGQFVADAREVGEVGVGSTQSEAVRDLQATLTELYLSLERDRDRLGADMAKVWAVMQTKVTKRP